MPLVLVGVVSLNACGPSGQDPGTTSGPGTSSGSTTGETTPTSTSGDDTGTTVGATTSVDTGTTQPVDTTGLATTGIDTTGLDTTSVETTGTTADDGTSTGDTDDIPDTTGGERCGPGADEVDIEWALEVPPGLVGVDIEASCEIDEAVEMEPAVTVTMTCDVRGEQQQIALHYELAPFRQFEWTKNGDVKLDYRADQAPFAREWLQVIATPITFRAVHADTLAPPGVTVEEFYFQEIRIEAPCDPQPDACGQGQGLELGFKYWVEGMIFWLPIRSGETMSFGFPVLERVWLEHASRLLEPIGCADVAPRWFDLMIISDGSGV